MAHCHTPARRLPPLGRTSPPTVAAAAVSLLQDAASLAQLKADGNSHFAKKEYDTAIACYDKALGMVPADAADAALLHSNKAACHMMHKRCVAGWMGAWEGRRAELATHRSACTCACSPPALTPRRLCPPCPPSPGAASRRPCPSAPPRSMGSPTFSRRWCAVQRRWSSWASTRWAGSWGDFTCGMDGARMTVEQLGRHRVDGLVG